MGIADYNKFDDQLTQCLMMQLSVIGAIATVDYDLLKRLQKDVYTMARILFPSGDVFSFTPDVEYGSSDQPCPILVEMTGVTQRVKLKSGEHDIYELQFSFKDINDSSKNFLITESYRLKPASLLDKLSVIKRYDE